MQLSEKPRLTYFNVPGRVAGLRIILFKLYGKDGWEDERVSFQDWPQLKPSMPLNCMPVLTLPDGTKVQQCEAMMRWAGSKAGLYPADVDEALFVDEMVQTVFEALAKAPRASKHVSKDMLPELGREFIEGPLKVHFTYIQGRIKGPFFLGEDLSIADLSLYMLINMIVKGEVSYIPASYVKDFPGISANYAAVKAHDVVKAYDCAYADASDATKEVEAFEAAQEKAS
jgi:glutathione S-transferase